MPVSHTRPATFIAALLGAALIGGLAVACGGNGDGGTGPTPPSSSATVTIGDFFFQSDRNATRNPAMDTVAVGGSVKWTWTEGEHSVQSLGTPGFASSPIQATVGDTFRVTFDSAGSYSYDCLIHGSAMTGIVVVR